MIDRQEIILEHMAMAIRLAHKRAMTYSMLDCDEMVGEALLALVEASWHYDSTKSKKKWFQQRIRGAMIDRIRRDDPSKQRTRSIGKIEFPEAFLRYGIPTRLNEDVYELDNNNKLPGSIAAQEEQTDARIMLEKIIAALDTIHPRHRDVYQRYYFKDHDLKDISSDMGVSDMRVSQMLSKARDKVNTYLENKQ